MQGSYIELRKKKNTPRIYHLSPREEPVSTDASEDTLEDLDPFGLQ